MKDNRTIGLKIAQMRQGKSMTQSQLASMLNVSHQAVSKWESGQALPDIATMLELTHLFGITIEDLIEDEYEEPEQVKDHAEGEPSESTETKENVNMNINELLQMAAFMSKEAVGEIAMKINETISAWHLAKLAPFVRQEVLEALIEKHHPEMNWDTLRRLAPFMSREKVDELAKEISEGKRSIHPTQDEINKAIDDIGKTIDEIGKDVGKALDDFGKGVGETMQKVFRFGESMINDVAEVFNDLASDTPEAERKPRSERAAALRKKAFERALVDGRFDWIAEHMSEISDDTELKARIALEARKREMHDWICAHMGDYADEFSVTAAIENGNWTFLGDNVWQFSPEMQETVAKAAAKAENWEWLEKYSDQLEMPGCAYDIAAQAMKSGAKLLAQRLCELHMNSEEIGKLVKETADAQDWEGLQLIIGIADDAVSSEVLLKMADKGEWVHVGECIAAAGDELKEELMEKAVDQGNFDAVDMLDEMM